MEPLFEVKSVLNERCYEELNRVSLRLKHVGVFYGVMAGLFFLFAVVSLSAENWLRTLLWTAVAVFLLWLWGSMPKTAARRTMQTDKYGANRPFTIRFFADELVEFTPRSEMGVRYEELYRVVQTADTVFLFIGEGRAFVLPREAFTRGTADGLMAFLASEKRLPCQRV